MSPNSPSSPDPLAPRAKHSTAEIDVSVVVPIFDEEENLPILHKEIVAGFEGLGLRWEVIYVDDCSSDGSLQIMINLWKTDEHVRAIQFRGRSGQTSAMAAGFEESRGRIVITMDGDLQNDPADIPLMLECMEAGGADIVAGWRKQRNDGFLLRLLPSMIANRLIGHVTKTTIHDTGCSLKAFRRELVLKLPIYAEQHRFLPAMSAGSGAKVLEVAVNHRARRFGKSKYGLGRATRVVLDLMTIKMITSFSQHPLQYFVMIAMPFGLATLILAISGTYAYFGTEGAEGLERISFLAFLLMFMAGVYFFLLGLLAEFVVKVSDLHGSEKGRRISTQRLGFDTQGGSLGA
ncbi:MAG: glycosyltransferase involved in cell wall biosynthesis [Candidatus Paceibacteria bacterium]|jgi:glycosyltransferase involved in cell wall biosynthesis